MNIAFFLTLKKDVAYLYDNYSIRQALEKMRHHGYSSIPVIDHAGKYVGTVTEGDFLWYLVDKGENVSNGVSLYNTEELQLKELTHHDRKAVRITATMDELLELAMRQNFVPVTDDVGKFIGIVTRRNVIRYFVSGKEGISPKGYNKSITQNK